MAWLVLAQAIVAMSGPVAIETVEQAKATPPQALADALLAPGHPSIGHVEVAPATMDPPLPPGQFRVILNTRPVPAATPGFCEQSRIDALVLDRGADAIVTLTKVEKLHRLAKVCADAKQSLGDYKQAYGRYEDARAMAVIQQLDQMRRSKLAVRVEYRDDMPRRLKLRRYADGVEALKAVDLDHISWAGDARRGGSLPEEKVLRYPRPGEDQTGFYAGGTWSGIVTRRNGRITHVWLERSIPAPF